jgi:hypothetical protein
VEIVVKAQPIILYFCIALVVVVGLAVLLKKGSVPRRVAVMAIVVAACGAILFFLYRDKRIVVDDQGITGSLYGKISVTWQEVRAARVVGNLSATPWAPRFKTNGVDIGPYRMGWFKLANGSTGYVLTDNGDRALVMETAGVTYVLGPRELDALAAAVAAHVHIGKGTEGGQ